MEDLPHLQSINITAKEERMKKKEQKQKEPTNKELLNIIIEVADLAVAILNEHREFLQNIKNMPKTQEEMELRAIEMAETIEKTNKQCYTVQNAFTKYAHLINLEEDTAEEAQPNTGEPENGTNTNSTSTETSGNDASDSTNDAKHNADTSSK
jgi:hypothetical protein